MSESIGRIVRLQVHAEPLKQDGAYVPDPLVSVDRAVVNADGMLGWNKPRFNLYYYRTLRFGPPRHRRREHRG